MGGGEALFFSFFPLCFFPFWVFTFFRVSSSSNNGLSKTPFRLNQIVKGEVVLRREEVELGWPNQNGWFSNCLTFYNMFPFNKRNSWFSSIFCEPFFLPNFSYRPLYIKKTLQELRMLSLSLFIQRSQSNC